MAQPDTTAILVKLADDQSALSAADSTTRLRPLYRTSTTPPSLTGQPTWFQADIPTGPTRNPWDLTHQQVADSLGLDPASVLFAEPDLDQTIYPDSAAPTPALTIAGGDCSPQAQDASHHKPTGPGFAWHLGGDYTDLGAARDLVTFTEPRTRIAHIDTGYYPGHETLPQHLLTGLQHSFVNDGHSPDNAADPDNKVPVLDNSGHGTGTIGILAGNRVHAAGDMYLGGAPHAEVLPLRIADSVVLFRTSALAAALTYATEQHCDVITLSMGGLPSRAWAEALDAAYEQGVVLCAAAGNHVNGSPPHTTVYPARFARAISVCGVMADNSPYDGLGFALQGSAGPPEVMQHALSTYTPNIPWPLWGCPTTIRLNGEGTSAATPQVAAAAALWIEHNKNTLPRTWQRVEAVRHALFNSAKPHPNRDRIGNGILNATAALGINPTFGLPQSPRSTTSFAFLRLITGIGLDEPTTQEEMFNLELAQRWLVNPELGTIIANPDATTDIDTEQTQKLITAILEDANTSDALRRHVQTRYRSIIRGTPNQPPTPDEPAAPDDTAACPPAPGLGNPPHRMLRVYTVDPTLAIQLDRSTLTVATLPVPWETVPPNPGERSDDNSPTPFGEYFTMDDHDPTGHQLGTAQLNDSRVAVQDGYDPSETNPHFHQQMVYAVARSTVQRVERALGRPVQWRGTGRYGTVFRQRLTLRPHAIHEANAYYSPTQGALLFGFFEATADDPNGQWSGTRTYTCLAHDIIAHETTHAILDGMHRHFNEPTNPDVLAFHEALGDIVALLQRFTLTELLEHEIRSSRGNLAAETLLGSLAAQFGRATGRQGALRDAIGHHTGSTWTRLAPDPAAYPNTTEPHARGAILVRAVFDAYLAIYQARTEDLFRLASGGTGILKPGAIPTDLATRLAEEAAKAAGHVLNMVLRAVDYLPPTDPTFYELLRAIITADFDLVDDDQYGYRIAFIDAFRRHGIRPLDPPKPDSPSGLSVDALRWDGPGEPSREMRPAVRKLYADVCDELKTFADACIYKRDRSSLASLTRTHRARIKTILSDAITATPAICHQLGISPDRRLFSVEELRRAVRVGPNGQPMPQVIATVTQAVPIDKTGRMIRTGCTIIMDLVSAQVTYIIGKGTTNSQWWDRTAKYLANADADPLRRHLLGADNPEPFALLHSLLDTR